MPKWDEAGLAWDDGSTLWDGGSLERWVEQPTAGAAWNEAIAAGGIWTEQPEAD